MVTEHAVEDWTALTEAFTTFFAPHGEVQTGEERATFRAQADDVRTSFTVYNDGRFAAAMPLHEVDANAERIVFDAASHSLRCEGTFGGYTYRIPRQLIER